MKFRLTIILLLALFVAERANCRQLSDEQLRLEGNRALDEEDNPGKAERLYNSVLDRHKDLTNLSETDRENVVLTLGNLCHLNMYYKHDYQHALDYMLQSMRISPDMTAAQLMNLGDIMGFYAQCFPSEDNVGQALELHSKAMEKAMADKNRRMACYAFSNLWNYGFDDWIVRKNAHATEEFGKIDFDSSDPLMLSAKKLHEAIVRIQRREYDAAIKILEGQLKCFPGDDAASLRERCQILCYLSELGILTDDPQLTIGYAKQIEEFSKADGMKDFRRDAAGLLAKAYDMAGDAKTADHYRLLYFETRDSLLVQHKLNNVGTGLLKFSLDEASRKMEILQSQRRLQLLVIAIISIGIAAVVLLLIIIWRKNRVLKENNLTLYNNIQAMIEKENEERKKYALQAARQADADEGDDRESRKKYETSQLTEEDKQRLRQTVERVLLESREIYDNDFTLNRLADLCGSTYKTLSQVINECFGCSFPVLIGDQRIKEACRRIGDKEEYGHLTLEAIGQSVGFKARSAFIASFKRSTGLTPGQYQRIVRQQQQRSNP